MRTPEQLARYNAQRRARRAAHPDTARARERAYYAAHLETKRAQLRKRHQSPEAKAKKRAYNQSYYKANQEKLIAEERHRREANREKIRRQSRERRAENPEKFRARDRARSLVKHRAWRAKSREQVRAFVRARSALRRGAPSSDLTAAQWLEIQAHFHHCCAYCGKRAKGHLTQDHITPLAKGGAHTASNVVPACRSCNSRKGTKPPPIPVQPLLLTVAPAKKGKA